MGAAGQKAHVAISFNDSNKRCFCLYKIIKAKKTYSTNIKGTKIRATAPIRLTPPNSTVASKNAIKKPVKTGGIDSCAKIHPSVFDCKDDQTVKRNNVANPYQVPRVGLIKDK